MASLCSIALCLLMIATAVLSYPNGPPESACESMTPSHYPATPSNDKSPYEVTIKGKVKKYKPGQEIKVKISGDTTFKGFFLQARAADGSSSDPVGTFINPPAGTQLVNCGSAGTAVGHSSRDEKNDLEFTWVAPDDYDQAVVFLATVVQEKNTFWVKLSSKKLPKDPCDPNPCENGQCVKKKKGNGFTCDCDEGFTGTLCADSTDKGEDACDPNPCENSGVCSTTAKGKSKCKCKNGYKGKKCEKDACDPNPCKKKQKCTRTKKGKAKCK